MMPTRRISSWLGLRVAAIALLSFACGSWLPAAAAHAEQAPLVLEAPFGEHEGLRIVDDAVGATALAWRTTSGEGRSIRFSEIAPGAEEATTPETVVGTPQRRLSMPVLATSPAGRIAVAWYEERETAWAWDEDLLAVKVRERRPDGSWEAARTLWRATAKTVYRSGSLVASLDDSGDAAVLWVMEQERVAHPQAKQLLIATRHLNGAYTAPVTLDREAAATEPALAVTSSGEVTALWGGTTATEGPYTESWQAGTTPGGPPVSLDGNISPEFQGSDGPFTHLLLQTSASGEQLAVWLKGNSGEPRRPKLVALRAAWRSSPGPFNAPQTVSPPGVEAREPALVLSGEGRALLAWSEIGADGSGPLLNYATAEPEAPLAAGVPAAVTLNPQGGLNPEGGVTATWLPNGDALLAWDGGRFEYAEEVAPAAPLGPGIPIRAYQDEDAVFPEQLQLVGGEAARPVLAWVGRSPSDFATSAVRYVIGADLPSFAAPAAGAASLLGGHAVAAEGVTVTLQCTEACSATVTGAAYALRPEDDESAAASAWATVGRLTPIEVSLRSAGQHSLELRLTGRARKRFCRTARRGYREAVRVTAVIRTSHAGTQPVVLGEEPTSRGCP